MTRFISPQDLYEKIKEKQPLTLLDIRSPDIFSQHYIYQSINIPLKKLPKKQNSLPKNKDVVIISEKSRRAKTVALALNKNGFQTYILKKGLKGWNSVYDIVKVKPSQPSKLSVFQIKRLGKGCLSYIVVLPDQKSAIIIDPTHHIQTYTDFLKTHKLKAVAVADTHIHSDHVSGGFKLAKKLSIPYLLPQKSEAKLSFLPLETILQKFFENTKITILETPGHTKESVCIILDQFFIFTGDTLLLDVIGRPDINEDVDSNSELLHESIKKKLFTLDEDIFVLPAHTIQEMVPGPIEAATMRYVKRFNSLKKSKFIKNSIKERDKQISPMIKNYQKIKKINSSRTTKIEKTIDKLELGGNFYPIVLKQKK